MYALPSIDEKLIPLLNELMKRAAACARVTVPELRGRRNGAAINIARSSCMYLFSELGLSSKQIGALLGARDYRTVYRLVRNVRTKLEERDEEAIHVVSWILRLDGELLTPTNDVVTVQELRKENEALKAELKLANEKIESLTRQAEKGASMAQDYINRFDWVEKHVIKLFQEARDRPR